MVAHSLKVPAHGRIALLLSSLLGGGEWAWKVLTAWLRTENTKKEETSNPFKSSPPAAYKPARISPLLRGYITCLAVLH